MKSQHFRSIVQNITLLFGSLVFSFIVIEIGFRIFDPTPFFSDLEINNTEHGNLSMYDDTLGWRGVPGGETEFVTRNNRVWLAHNSDGFRDIEHDPIARKNPAIVFLGDSFTWGYEVEFEEMFVNRLRKKLPGYELVNLAHRGYGTDQEWLTFQRWSDRNPLELVVLMFSENDVHNNSTAFSDDKWKPKYQLQDNALVLTGVPVPRDESWQHASATEGEQDAWKAARQSFFYSSHFVNNMRIRYKLYRARKQKTTVKSSNSQVQQNSGMELTVEILKGLRNEITRRGSRLLVVFIPSKLEIDSIGNSIPYQTAFSDWCENLSLECLDLAPAFKKVFLRTYYRQGMHWNARGHEVAAEALYDYLENELALDHHG